MPRISKEEKRFRAEMDAGTLAEAGVIKDDPDRLAAARQAAKSMATNAEKAAKEMRNVASQRRNRTAKEKQAASESAQKRARAAKRKPPTRQVNPLLKGLTK